jgi:CheY-like chemotaxis protein
MNGILGMTGLLLDTELTPEQRTYASAISTSAKTLLALIDEILDFSKIEAGRIELRPKPFDIADAAQGVVELLAPRARDKGLEIGWLAAPDLPKTVTGDETRIRQILMNLVGNAIKFTEQGGVALTLDFASGVSRDEDGRVWLRFAVRDTGPGVPQEALTRIFAEFEQAESGPTRRHGGSGLGLAISKRLVEAMGGRIGVTSLPGEGATFTVDLPFVTQAHVPALGGDWPRPRAGEKILLVLGGALEGALTAELLASCGVETTRVSLKDAAHVASGAAARGVPFTALLTDRWSADAGAVRLLPHLQARSVAGQRAHAVVIVDPSERGEIGRFRALGFNGYLVRPVRPVSLLTQIFGASPEHRATMPDAPQPPRAARRAARAGGISILLAEDNDINALLACTLLEKSGAHVVRARNGAQAIAAVRKVLTDSQGPGFDLVLMDIHMPDMDGVEAARRIRALYPDGAWPTVGRPPIVALTANAFAEDRAAYLKAGLDDYLAKPFEKADLAALLARWRLRPEGREESNLGAA